MKACKTRDVLRKIKRNAVCVCVCVGEESGRCIPQSMSRSSAPGIMKTFEGKEETCFYSQGLS